MSHRTIVPAEVIADINDIPDVGVRRAAARVLVELRENPYRGEEMYERGRTANLKDARKVPFDKEGWRDKPRYRLVYENDPDDGSVQVLLVLAVGLRGKLTAYRLAAARRRNVRRRHLGEQ